MRRQALQSSAALFLFVLLGVVGCGSEGGMPGCGGKQDEDACVKKGKVKNQFAANRDADGCVPKPN